MTLTPAKCGLALRRSRTAIFDAVDTRRVDVDAIEAGLCELRHVLVVTERAGHASGRPVVTEKSVLVAAVDVAADDGYASGHDVGAPVLRADPANMGALARRAPARSLAVTAPTAGAASQSAAHSARGGGPFALGPAVPHPDPMADGAHDRQA